MVFGLEKIGLNKSLTQLGNALEGIFQKQYDEKLEKDKDVLEIYGGLRNIDTTSYETISPDSAFFNAQKIIAESITAKSDIRKKGNDIKKTEYFKNIQQGLTEKTQDAYSEAEKKLRACRKDYILRHPGEVNITDSGFLERCVIDLKGIFEKPDYRKEIEDSCDFRSIKYEGAKFIEKEDEIKQKTGYALFMIMRDRLREQITNLGSNIERGSDLDGVKRRIGNIERIYTLEVFKTIKVFEYDQHIILQPHKTQLLENTEAILKNPNYRIRWMGLEGILGRIQPEGEELLKEGNLEAVYKEVDEAISNDLRSNDFRIEQYRIGSRVYSIVADMYNQKLEEIKAKAKGDTKYENVIKSLETQEKRYRDTSKKYSAVEAFLQDIFQRKENIRLALNVLNYLVKENGAKPLEAIQKAVSEKEPAQLQSTVSYLVDKGFVKEGMQDNMKVYSLNKEDRELHSIATRMIPQDIKDKFKLIYDNPAK
ncbi:hypothetical protein J4209_02485 [Candidatus Woesearchaeota archaeon]|nr:hypothetical protein [Candidatus Woesearchaeota archaeon]